MPFSRSTLYAALMLVLLAAVAAGAGRLAPVDESASDPSFQAFKTRLLAALQRKDVAALLAAVDPQVRVSFGEPDGPNAFRRHWKLDKPAESPVWDELQTILRLGATRDEAEFIAPYVFTRFPHELDAFTHAAIVRPAAALRSKPAVGSPRVAALDYDIVQLLGDRQNGLIKVRTQNGKSGWVLEQDIRSPLNYRAFFEKKAGQWKLTAFVSGD